MDNQPIQIRPRILYYVAKAAWEGKLYERREEIWQLVYNEYQHEHTRKQIANQIRLAMGLKPHDSEQVINENDQEALMGLADSSVMPTDEDLCRICTTHECEKACPTKSIKFNESGHISIDRDTCIGDGSCIHFCPIGALAEKSEIANLITLLREQNYHVYASIAPAFAGQFGNDITFGKLRSGLIKLGFTDAVETALAADLVTMKEAFEFDEHVKTETDFMITSCCCPAWIKLIENRYPDLIPHISPSVSPMIASARIIKLQDPNAKVVFIGPCIAKKAEAKLPELNGNVDYVLTFQELLTIFNAANINLLEMPDEASTGASSCGRRYGRTGGVSEAVEITLMKMVPRRAQNLRAVKIDGIPDCIKLLDKIKQGQLDANFIEGMACKGGCVGGPGRLRETCQTINFVNAFSAAATAESPVENPNVYSILSYVSQDNTIPDLTGQGPISRILSRNINS